MAKDPDDELREELQYHLDRRAELDRATKADARRQFGNVTQTQEELRAMRIPIWLDGLRQDLAYAIRAFTRTPGFTAASVIALALGIGSVTAVFSVIDPLLFRPLPYEHAERLASVGMAAPIEPEEWLLGPDYYEWGEQQKVFQSMTATTGIRTCDMTEGDPERLHCGNVEANFLSTFGVHPIAGRDFSAQEDQPNAAPVAIATYAMWQARFGGSPIVGRQIELDGRKTEIIGILPKDFEFPNLSKIEFLVPMRVNVQQQRARGMMIFVRVFGRLKPGISVEQARDSLQPLFDHSLQFVPPAFRTEVKLRVTGFREHQVREFKTASLVLLGSVLGVLLVACANVANLMLARGSTRDREMAVRAAIGASRLRLVRQTLTENLFLGGAAGLLGIGLAYLLLVTARNLAPEGIPRLATATLDWRVLLAALAISIAAGTLAGLAPAMRIPSPESLTGARTTGARRDWLRQVLAAAQIAISLVLLFGSGLLIRSLWRIQQINLGVRTSQVLVARVEANRQIYKSPESIRGFYMDLEQRLRAIPGVESLAISDSLPPMDRTMITIFSRIQKEGQEVDLRSGTGGMVTTRSVTPSYFQVLDLPMLRGRRFVEEDRDSADAMVIIDETLARRLYPGEDPVGKRIRPGGNGDWLTITGVSHNARNAGLFTASDPEYYTLMRTHGRWDRTALSVLIRTQRDARAISPLIRAEINRLAPKLPVEIESLDTRVRQLAARPRFNAILLGVFATFALALAAIGLAGVMSYLVTQRTQELGVRMALGATPNSIRTLVLKQSLKWILAGAVAGLATGLLSMRGIKSLLYEVEPYDPLIIGSVTATLIAVGILSAWLPARRAARLDPMVALRHD